MKHTLATLLQETIGHYNLGKRSSTASGMCSYLSDDGRMCAVGRCLKPEYLETFHEIEENLSATGAFGTAICEIFESSRLEGLGISDVVRGEYSDIKLEDWKKVQRLHDHPDNWDENGLSGRGRKAIRDSFGWEIFHQVFPPDKN
jgi:hypothetical protein